MDEQLEYARSLVNEGDLEAAVNVYRGYLFQVDDQAQPHLELARLYQKIDRPRRALNHYRQAQMLDPENEDVEFEAFSLSMKLQHVLPNEDEHFENEECRELNEKGNRLLLENKVTEALEFFEKGLALKPDSYALWNNVGMCHHRLEKYEKAESAYRKSLEIKPKYGLGLYNLATVFIKTQRLEEALEMLDSAREINAEDADVWFNLGFCLMELERYDEALENFTEVLEIRSDYHAATYNIFASFALLGERHVTFMWLRKLMKVRPDWNTYIQTDERFQWVVEDPEYTKIILE